MLRAVLTFLIHSVWQELFRVIICWIAECLSKLGCSLLHVESFVKREQSLARKSVASTSEVGHSRSLAWSVMQKSDVMSIFKTPASPRTTKCCREHYELALSSEQQGLMAEALSNDAH
jgi:hypothetical protein